MRCLMKCFYASLVEKIILPSINNKVTIRSQNAVQCNVVLLIQVFKKNTFIQLDVAVIFYTIFECCLIQRIDGVLLV